MTPQDRHKTAPRPPQALPRSLQVAPRRPRGPKRFHLSSQINVSRLCSMLVIFAIEINFASSQEAINKVQEVYKINISEPPSFRASTPLSLQVPRRDSRSANNSILVMFHCFCYIKRTDAYYCNTSQYLGGGAQAEQYRTASLHCVSADSSITDENVGND